MIYPLIVMSDRCACTCASISWSFSLSYPSWDFPALLMFAHRIFVFVTVFVWAKTMSHQGLLVLPLTIHIVVSPQRYTPIAHWCDHLFSWKQWNSKLSYLTLRWPSEVQRGVDGFEGETGTWVRVPSEGHWPSGHLPSHYVLYLEERLGVVQAAAEEFNWHVQRMQLLFMFQNLTKHKLRNLRPLGRKICNPSLKHNMM